MEAVVRMKDSQPAVDDPLLSFIVLGYGEVEVISEARNASG